MAKLHSTYRFREGRLIKTEQPAFDTVVSSENR